MCQWLPFAPPAASRILHALVPTPSCLRPFPSAHLSGLLSSGSSKDLSALWPSHSSFLQPVQLRPRTQTLLVWTQLKTLFFQEAFLVSTCSRTGPPLGSVMLNFSPWLLSQL
jgi:hypothetical protein